MNYDPALMIGGRMAKQSVVVTLQRWEFSTTMAIEIRGNCIGMAVLDSAISMIYESLLEQAGNDPERVKLDLIDEAGGVLELFDDDNQGEDWLAGYVVGMQIVSIDPDHELELKLSARREATE